MGPKPQVFKFSARVLGTMANAWLNPLAALCVISVLVRPGGGERFFQYRDHRDQRLYERHATTMSVHNKLEAEVRTRYVFCSVHMFAFLFLVLAKIRLGCFCCWCCLFVCLTHHFYNRD